MDINNNHEGEKVVDNHQSELELREGTWAYAININGIPDSNENFLSDAQPATGEMIASQLNNILNSINRQEGNLVTAIPVPSTEVKGISSVVLVVRK